ncbi:MAG: hypothetical protein U1E38_07100 [Rhodospirillales bacterium]
MLGVIAKGNSLSCYSLTNDLEGGLQMAYTKLLMENPKTGQLKEAPVGFSWTVFFFGFFPPLFRGDWKWAIIIFLLALLTWGLSNLIFMFIYNKLYIKDLLGDGFKVKSVGMGTVEQLSLKIGVNLPALDLARQSESPS